MFMCCIISAVNTFLLRDALNGLQKTRTEFIFAGDPVPEGEERGEELGGAEDAHER